MKKYVLMLMMLVFAGFLTTSCEKEDSDEMEDEMMQLDGTSSSSSKTIPIEDLPVVITDYITANYPDTTIKEAEMEEDGSIEVDLDNGWEVSFDADGNFVEAEMEEEDDDDDDGEDDDDNQRGDDDDDDGDDDDDESDDDDENIPVADLPVAITDYVAANYPDATIVEAEREEDGGYEVELDNGMELEFDADGNFVAAEMEEEDDDDEDGEDENILVADLPVAITDYVAANYPGTTIVEAEREDDGGYEVELDNGIELEFDADGNFLKED